MFFTWENPLALNNIRAFYDLPKGDLKEYNFLTCL